MQAADPFDLQRFVTAQAPVFDSALEELKKGRKRAHWMWFVFPQLRGLGSSSMANLLRHRLPCGGACLPRASAARTETGSLYRNRPGHQRQDTPRDFRITR
jgi:hypothetical protein